MAHPPHTSARPAKAAFQQPDVATGPAAIAALRADHERETAVSAVSMVGRDLIDGKPERFIESRWRHGFSFRNDLPFVDEFTILVNGPVSD